MANQKISELTLASTPLAGTEVLPIVQGGVTVKVSAANVTAGRAVSASSLTLSTALAVTSGGTGQTTYTDGQLLIGNTTGNTLTKATLTAGSGVTITNGSGSVTIAATGSGTVTSVGGTGTVSGLTLTGTVTTSGNLTLGGTLSVTPSDFASQTANTFLAAPNGAPGAPTFRAMLAADVPTLNQNTTGTSANVTGTVAVANGGTGQTSYTDGQLLIGNTTGNTLTKTTLTAGSGITITNGAGSITIDAVGGGGGTVTSVGGTGTVNGITLTGTVTTSGSLTLGGTLSGVSLTTQVSGTLPVANGGTGITSFGTGVATFLGTPSSANLAAAVTDETGTGALVFATSPALVTPVLGTPTSGTLSNCTVDGTTSVGFRTIPQNSQSANYTLVLDDSGRHIFHPVADNNARTFTIPANGSVAFPVGTAVTFINMSVASVTIAITTDTLTLSSAGTSGSRTLATNGSATCIKITSTQWLISGSGLT